MMFYEPWTPHVGSRVRVKLNGERHWDPDGGTRDGHEAILNRQLGAVVEIDRAGWLKGHHYFVELDACSCGEPQRSGEPCHEWFAAVELESIGIA
jgi:hypothetical protein